MPYETSTRTSRITEAVRTAGGLDGWCESVPVQLADDCGTQAQIYMHLSPDGRPFYAVRTSVRREEENFRRMCGKFDFTRHEIEIVRELVRGMTNAQISASLFISVRTVENHLRAIYEKAHVNSRSQLISQMIGNYAGTIDPKATAQTVVCTLCKAHAPQD